MPRLNRREALRIVGVAVAVGVVVNAINIGRAIEQWAAPIIANQTMRFQERGARYGCAVWSFRKMRNARLESINFDIVDPRTGALIADTVGLTPASDGRGLRTLKVAAAVAAPGIGQRILCLDLAQAGISPSDPVDVVGTVYYLGVLGAWKLKVDLPLIKFPPYKPT